MSRLKNRVTCHVLRVTGITLVELMIAVSLIVVLFAGVTVIDVANNRMYVKTNAETELLQESTAVLEHMKKRIREGQMVQVDSDKDELRVWKSSIVVGDPHSLYQLDSSSKQVRFWDVEGQGSYQILASRVTGFDLTNPAADAQGKVSWIRVKITTSGQWGGNMVTKTLEVQETIGARSFTGLTITTS